jgi:hypothetical protein
MSKPSKNILQEYCQKNKIDLPVYNSTATNGGYRSTVRVLKLETFSDVKVKKVDAESQAAEKMIRLLNLEEDTKADRYVNSLLPKILHVVDGENMILDSPPQREDEAWFTFFYKNHNRANTHQPFEKILINSSRPDGVDSYIQLWVGYELASNPHLEMVYIHTRDKFGHSLVDAIHDITNGRVRAEVV